jgi:glycosyltransferase involved in cell wall biosynthesis
VSKRHNYNVKVSIIAGVVNSPDAISETALADLEAFDRVARSARQAIDVRVFCCASNVADSRIRLFDDWRDVIRSEHFITSDLYVYHFGIFNPIHDTLPFARRDSFVSVFFHNVTPPQYVPPEMEETLHKSYQQIENFRSANVIMTASHFSREAMLDFGLDKPIVVMPLFGPNTSQEPPAARPPRRPGEPIKMLFCGRFAASKGLLTLTEAVRLLSQREDCPVELMMTGMMDFSDAGYVREVRRSISELPKTVRANITPDLSSEQLKQFFQETDVFVLPSLHEGFGMPVAEALSAGTPVVCSDAGALPEVAGGMALTFACGRADDLAAKLEAFRDAFLEGEVLYDNGTAPLAQWRAKAGAHGKSFTREAYLARISEHFSRWLGACAGNSDPYRERVARLVSAVIDVSRDGSEQIDHALAGALLIAKATDSLSIDEMEGLRVLLRWAFPQEQSDADLAYWHSQLDKLGLTKLLKKLAEAKEVRSSFGRLRTSPFILGAYKRSNGGPKAKKAAADDAKGVRQFVLSFLLDAPLSNVEFVHEAYRLLLQREPELDGFTHYVHELSAGRTTREAMVNEIANSPEAVAKARQEPPV